MYGNLDFILGIFFLLIIKEISIFRPLCHLSEVLNGEVFFFLLGCLVAFQI